MCTPCFQKPYRESIASRERWRPKRGEPRRSRALSLLRPAPQPRAAPRLAARPARGVSPALTRPAPQLPGRDGPWLRRSHDSRGAAMRRTRDSPSAQPAEAASTLPPPPHRARAASGCVAVRGGWARCSQEHAAPLCLRPPPAPPPARHPSSCAPDAPLAGVIGRFAPRRRGWRRSLIISRLPLPWPCVSRSACAAAPTSASGRTPRA